MNVGGVEIEVVRDNLTLRTANTATDSSSLCKRFSNDLDYDVVVLDADGKVYWSDSVPDIINVSEITAREPSIF